MAGLPGLQQHLELEEDEDVRPLTDTGSASAARRRHISTVTSIECCVSRGKCVILMTLTMLVAGYILGKENAHRLRTGSSVSNSNSNLPEGNPPVVVNTRQPPTYQPTEVQTDPPVPTYDPTKAGTLTPTFRQEIGTDPPVPTYDPTNADTLTPTFRQTMSHGLYIPSPNPYIDKFNTTEWRKVNTDQWNQRYENALQIAEKYGTYCPDEEVPMCPVLTAEDEIANKDWQTLLQGPTTRCILTGNEWDCGVNNPWLNKTIWPLIRGPFCSFLNSKRSSMPDELMPYHELGYDRSDPTKSTDAAPFDGGPPTGDLWFDANKVKDHFLKFEAMLEHYYEGLSHPLLESAIAPRSESSLYGPMLQQYADQIARALLRRKENGEEDDGIVIGILGDSVTSGTDNCYYDAWPEQFRRQMAPLFGSMGLKVEIRNAAKNGGWLLAPQMLCANDMLGGSNRKNDAGLDFIIQLNPFVRADDSDAEHLIRRSLFGQTHTLVALSIQNNMNADDFIQRYASAGLIMTSEPDYKVPDLNFTIPGHSYWFPDLQKAFWGMQSDGFCRIATRADSAPVVKRNWHWGPLIHQTFADSFGLLFSRAIRLALEDLAAGKMPPEPPGIDNYERILNESNIDDEKTQTWKKFLVADMASNDFTNGGISGVHCAIGPANQPGSTILAHWLKFANESPFETLMNSRSGVSFVPPMHDSQEGSSFYTVDNVMSAPNDAVKVGDWMPNPNKFSAEAPRTYEQCLHLDGGGTRVNYGLVSNSLSKSLDTASWVVWRVPERSISIGRIMICQPRFSKMRLSRDAFDTRDVRFHYAVLGESNDWKIVQDTQKNEYGKENDECTIMVNDIDEKDKAAAWKSGLWVAVEWKKESIFEFDYLVAM